MSNLPTRYKIQMSDNETKILSERQLKELCDSCMEYDGFFPFTVKELSDSPFLYRAKVVTR